jgi:hypothetical protein
MKRRTYAMERRSDQRIDDEPLCPVVFGVNGDRAEAHLIDISKSGAKLRAGDQIPGHMRPCENQLITYTFRTNYGDSTCLGQTCWIKRTENGWEWGIRFIELSEDPEDCLRRIVQALP